ncbi:integrase core domain-containing protein [Planctomycetota bacterium]
MKACILRRVPYPVRFLTLENRRGGSHGRVAATLQLGQSATDRDKCFCSDFDAVLRSANVDPIPTPYRAPNANALAERWIRSARQECLNRLILFGIKSLRRVVRGFQRSHNEHRPHQGIGDRIPARVRSGEVIPERTDSPARKVECEDLLGGLLRSYHRTAA